MNTIDDINLYPEMNQKIVEFLSLPGNDGILLYAAALIREYQKLGTVEELRNLKNGVILRPKEEWYCTVFEEKCDDITQEDIENYDGDFPCDGECEQCFSCMKEV